MTEHAYTPVRDVMTARPIVIDGMASVTQAVAMMRSLKISSLVVDKRYPGDEYGLLVVHNIAEHVVSKDRSPDLVSVYEIMSKPAVTVDAGMNVKYASRLLLRFQLTRALVLDKGAVVGIVTLRDLTLRSIKLPEEDGSDAQDAPGAEE